VLFSKSRIRRSDLEVRERLLMNSSLERKGCSVVFGVTAVLTSFVQRSCSSVNLELDLVLGWENGRYCGCGWCMGFLVLGYDMGKQEALG